ASGTSPFSITWSPLASSCWNSSRKLMAPVCARAGPSHPASIARPTPIARIVLMANRPFRRSWSAPNILTPSAPRAFHAAEKIGRARGDGRRARSGTIGISGFVADGRLGGVLLHRLDPLLHRGGRRVHLALADDLAVGRLQHEVGLAVLGRLPVESRILRRVR